MFHCKSRILILDPAATVWTFYFFGGEGRGSIWRNVEPHRGRGKNVPSLSPSPPRYPFFTSISLLCLDISSLRFSFINLIRERSVSRSVRAHLLLASIFKARLTYLAILPRPLPLPLRAIMLNWPSPHAPAVCPCLVQIEVVKFAFTICRNFPRGMPKRQVTCLNLERIKATRHVVVNFNKFFASVFAWRVAFADRTLLFVTCWNTTCKGPALPGKVPFFCLSQFFVARSVIQLCFFVCDFIHWLDKAKIKHKKEICYNHGNLHQRKYVSVSGTNYF